MERFTYENQGVNTYLVCEISNESIDTMSLGMLTNNRIAGFVPAIYTQLNENKYVKYNVSAKITMKQFFMGVVNRYRLLTVFRSIVSALINAEEYMIDTRAILLDMDSIFVNVSTCEAEVICVPILQVENMVADYSMFFKNVMFSTQFDKNENCNYVAVIINYLNSTPAFSVLDFCKILDELLEEGRVVEKQIQQSVQLAIEQPAIVAPTESGQIVFIDTANTQPNVQQESNPSWNTGMKQDKKQPNLAIQGGETVPAQKNETSDKSISMFYLLQHYNKENAAAYKAQKEAQKAEKEKLGNKDKQKTTNKKVSKVKKEVGLQGAYGYAIPGQPSFAIPTSEQTEMVPKQQSASIPSVVSEVTHPVMQTNIQSTVNSMNYSTNIMHGKAKFGETTVLGKGTNGQTTVLNATVTPTSVKPYIIRAKTQEKILLDKPIFRVGKEKSYVDYFIGDNTAISRSHANFIEREGKYYVVDTNSTNHTFVNGQMIQSNVEQEISDGAMIRLGNEEFEFRFL